MSQMCTFILCHFYANLSRIFISVLMATHIIKQTFSFKQWRQIFLISNTAIEIGSLSQFQFLMNHYWAASDFESMYFSWYYKYNSYITKTKTRNDCDIFSFEDKLISVVMVIVFSNENTKKFYQFLTTLYKSNIITMNNNEHIKWGVTVKNVITSCAIRVLTSLDK